MFIGERLRELRESKSLSQGDIQKRTGLVRCYTSRVENGHTVPTIETLEKYAHALEVPLYQLFYEGEEPPKVTRFVEGRTNEGNRWGSSGKAARLMDQFRRTLKQMDDSDRKLLLFIAQKMASHTGRRLKS